jgi:hypothetical protein
VNEESIAVLEGKPEVLAAAVDAFESLSDDQAGELFRRELTDDAGKITKGDRLDGGANDPIGHRPAHGFDLR